MNINPGTRTYFSDNKDREVVAKWLCMLFSAVFLIILLAFWEPLRSQAFMTAFADWRPDIVYDVFMIITMIGDDIGHIFIILIIFWCINKKLGFSTMMILLSSAIYMHLLKGVFNEPRPLEGQQNYDCLSFPSGHTLTTMTVWGYLAIRARHKALWAAALIIVPLVGLSRIVLGVHFPGDIIGGFIFGAIFLAAVFWFGRLLSEREGKPELSYSLPVSILMLGVLFSALSVLVLLYYNTADATMVMGFLAGLIMGDTLENSLVRFKTGGQWYRQLIKLVLGLGVLYYLARGLDAWFLSEPHWRLLQFFFTGLWVTFIAPYIFVITGLAGREKAESNETAIKF